MLSRLLHNELFHGGSPGRAGDVLSPHPSLQLGHQQDTPEPQQSDPGCQRCQRHPDPARWEWRGGGGRAAPFQLSPLGQGESRSEVPVLPCSLFLPGISGSRACGISVFLPSPAVAPGFAGGSSERRSRTLAKLSQARSGFGWGWGALAGNLHLWGVAEGQFGCPWGTGARDRTGTECLLPGPHREGAMVPVMEMSFPKGSSWQRGRGSSSSFQTDVMVPEEPREGTQGHQGTPRDMFAVTLLPRGRAGRRLQVSEGL